MTRSRNVRVCPSMILVVLVGLAGGLSEAMAADITLSWTDNSNNESGFLIQRKTGTSGTFAQIATVGTNVKSYVDTGLAASTTFCYRVRAFNSAGNSAFTPEGCKTTPSGRRASAGTVFLEAENGILTAPMVSRTDSTASNGQFVEVPSGTGNNLNDATNGGPGQVRFAISISQAGTRALWARTKAPDDASDSFYVTRNGTLVKEWSVPQSTTWKWNKVANLSLGFRHPQSRVQTTRRWHEAR